MTRLLLLLCVLLLSCTKPSAPAPAPTPQAQVAADAGAPKTGPEAAGAAPAAQAPRCSASTLSPQPSAVPTPLPPVVESMRRRIIAAAVACDYDALAKLARENGADFNVSFGPDFDPAAFWREREREGTPVLAQMVKVLNLPQAKEETLYLWPSAYRTGETEEDWKALEGLYPAEKLAEWRKGEDGYLGFRVGIEENGDWTFALSGD